MAKQKQVKDTKKTFEFDGVVKEAYQGSQFKVEIKHEGKTRDILVYISGRLRKNYIKILPGDEVRVEVTPYDLERGRIIYRYNK